MRRALRAGACLAGAVWAAGPAPAEEPQPPPGKERSTTTTLLETGAEILQPEAPVDNLALHLVGFHPMKHDPMHQMEAHHYCNQVNEEFAQCVLFDGQTEAARMNGIEYIISENLFEGLPAEEKKYWHPHNYEILSGQLIVPGIPAAAEHEAMARKINSYGKTWHVWKSGMAGEAGDPLPFGEPHLAWSFNRDGEAKPELVAARDARLAVDTAEVRKRRQDLVPAARPQCGVEALRERFPNPTSAIAGVSVRHEGCPAEDVRAP